MYNDEQVIIKKSKFSFYFTLCDWLNEERLNCFYLICVVSVSHCIVPYC